MSLPSQPPPAASDVSRERVKHPPGLWVLFITEMWERFSYYGMRALLVLYLIRSSSPVLRDGQPNDNPGFGWTDAAADHLYAFYTSAVYITPLVGGWLADRFLGTHRSLVIGGWIIALGHVTLAMTELFGITPGQVVTLQSSPGALICFISGLALIVIGTGFFKPCVSVMVGQLYTRDDPRKDSGFTIFYMGINLGAFFSPLVAGTLGEKVGWHWGFGSAAVGMVLGLVFYQLFRPRYLREIGLRPSHAAAAASAEESALHRMTRVDWERLVVLVALALLGNIFFWAAFEQAGTSLNIFASEKTDRTIGGLWPQLMERLQHATEFLFGFDWKGAGDGFPATWYQSVNPLAILIFGPVFAWLWVWLERRRLNPSTPMKFALGLYLLGLGFLWMVFGAMDAQRNGLAGPHWLLLTYLAATWGELCLSPVGLSLVTKLAPAHLQSLMMGIWFASMAASNFLAGQLAAFSTRFDTTQHVIAFEPSGLRANVWFHIETDELRLHVEGDPAVVGERLRFAGVVRGPDGPQHVELDLVPMKAENGAAPVPGLYAANLGHTPVPVTDIEQISGSITAVATAPVQSARLEHKHYTFILPGLPGFYLALVIFPIAAGTLIAVISPLLRRMMHGVH